MHVVAKWATKLKTKFKATVLVLLWKPVDPRSKFPSPEFADAKARRGPGSLPRPSCNSGGLPWLRNNIPVPGTKLQFSVTDYVFTVARYPK